MALTLQNLRAVGPGVEPASLLPGQLCFNIFDKVLYIGDGSAFKTSFDGTQVPGTPGAGWYSMPMNFDGLLEFFVTNPGVYGDTPSNQDVLTWDTSLNHPIWAPASGAGSVASVTGATPITVDNTDPDNPIVGVNFASTVAPGVVQLSDTTTSTSTTQALTAAQGKNLQDQIDALVITSNLTLAGTFDANSGLVDSVTSAGSSAGFLVGSPLPAAAVSNSGYFVIVDTQGSNGPSGTPPYHVGDWFLSDGSSWQFLNVGYQPPYATTTEDGVVLLATNTEVQAGVNSSKAVVPSALQSKLSNSVSTISSTTIASSTAAKTAYDAGLQGQTDAAAAQADATQALSDAASAQADATQALADAANAQATADAAIPDSTITAKGNLIAGTGASTYSALPVGSNGQILAANSACSTGLEWVTNVPDGVASVSGTSPIVVDNTDPANPVVEINAASTTQPGSVQLNNTVTSTLTTQAATANAVKTAYDAGVQGQTDAAAAQADATQALTDAASAQTTANAALPKAGGTMTGNITFNPGQTFPGVVTSVTAVGGSAVTVDNTDPTQPILDVDAATTTSPGVVQLNNSTTSPSTTEALTAAQGKVLQDQIDALVISSNLTLAGTFDASTGLVDSVTTAGTAAGFTVGSALPAPASGNADYFVIVDVQGSTGPSGTPPYHIGDWFLSDGSSWQFLNVGFQAPYATTTTEGVVQLATDAEVQAGSNTDHVVVPSSLQSKMSDSTSLTSSTTIASSTAVKSAYDLADAALPKTGGTMTGDITFFSMGDGVYFYDASFVNAISDSTSTTSSTTAASSTAVKSAYDLADAALPKAGGTMVGNLYISNSELQVDSSSIFTSVGTATFTGTTDLNGNTSFFFTPTWLENIGPASQVTFDNVTSGLAATNVQDAIDEVVSNSPWTESAGVISPTNAGSVVSVSVGAGVDGIVVEDAANSYYTKLKPSVVDLVDNVQSISINSGTSVITHIVDSLLTNTAGVVAQDETATLAPYNINASYLSLNGVATGINIRTLPWPQIESWDSMNINIANFNGALGVQAAGLDLVLIGGDNGGGVSYMQTQPNILLEALGPLNVKPATDAVDAVQFQTSAGSKILTVDTLAPAVKIGDGASAYTLPIADGAANYILSTDGSGTVSWVANAVDGVQSVSGTSPITVDNTDPVNPIVGINAASTTVAGAVQLNNTISSTSTSQAATANAVKLAYDAAISAAGSSPLASATVLFVNTTTGSDVTGQRGTAKPFKTITAALAAASEGDTIFVAPGTYAESVTLSKGVNLVGTYTDQAISSGPKIYGTFTVSISGPSTRNWAVANFQLQASSVGTNTVNVTNNSFGSGGLGSFTNCFFQMFTGNSITEQAFATSGTWTRSLYLRNCTFDGNFTHSAGTTAGASGYVVIDNWLGIAAADKYIKVTAGTCEVRNPSNAICPVLQTGGVFVGVNVTAWYSNTAATTTLFSGTGFAYKGTSAGLGQAYLYLTGQGSTVVEGTTWGKLSVGTNVVYAFGNVVYDTSLATLSGVPLTSAAPNPNGVLSTMARPQWSYLTTSSSVAAANQLGVVLDSTNGNVYTVTAYDAGTY